MNLHAFYNPEYIGDILLVRLTHIKKVTHFEIKGDVVVLYYQKDIIGYNVLNVSRYFEIHEIGKVKITEDFVTNLNKILKSNELPLVESDYNDHIIVGRIESMVPHPDSDHMNICQVSIEASKDLQIVCGAHNAKEGLRVVVATIDAVMPNGDVIRPSKLRGVPSDGMLCSARELGIENGQNGIIELNEDYKIGESFFDRRSQIC